MTTPSIKADAGTIRTALGEMTVVRATVADADTVHAIMCDAADWLKSCGIGQWSSVPTQQFRDFLPRRIAESEVYLLSQRDIPMATICVQWQDEDIWGERGRRGSAGFVHGFAIRRGVAGQGVGTSLLQWAEKHITGRGLVYVRLDCMNENEKLCRYYQTHGYTDVGTVTHKWGTSRLFEKAGPLLKD